MSLWGVVQYTRHLRPSESNRMLTNCQVASRKSGCLECCGSRTKTHGCREGGKTLTHPHQPFLYSPTQDALHYTPLDTLYTLSTYVPPLTALRISYGRNPPSRFDRVWYSARILGCDDFEREHGFGNVGGLGRQRADGAGNPGRGDDDGWVEGGVIARLGCECSNVRVDGRVAYGLTASVWTVLVQVLGPFPIHAREQHFLSPAFPLNRTFPLRLPIQHAAC